MFCRNSVILTNVFRSELWRSCAPCWMLYVTMNLFLIDQYWLFGTIFEILVSKSTKIYRVLWFISPFQCKKFLFSSPGPLGKVRYCHHFASVVFVVNNFQKSSPLKLLNRFFCNFALFVYGMLATKFLNFGAICFKTWPPLL